MVEVLKEALDNYAQITKRIIEALSKDEVDELEGLFLERQQVIDYINTINYSVDDFRALCEKVDMLALEEKLKIILVQKRDNVKGEIDKLSGYKNAKKNYTKKFSLDSIYFNKKI